MLKCEVCGKPLEITETDHSAKVVWYACPEYMAGDHRHTFFSEPLVQKWAANLLDDEGRVIPGYELRVKGSRDEVMPVYLYWLAAMKGREGVTEGNVLLEPAS